MDREARYYIKNMDNYVYVKNIEKFADIECNFKLIVGYILIPVGSLRTFYLDTFSFFTQQINTIMMLKMKFNNFARNRRIKNSGHYQKRFKNSSCYFIFISSNIVINFGGVSIFKNELSTGSKLTDKKSGKIDDKKKGKYMWMFLG